MMIAFRTTWYIKAGMMEKAVELLHAEMKRSRATMNAKGFDIAGHGRIYSPMQSPYALIFETSFENHADSEKFWSQYDRDSADAQKFWKQWYELVRDEGPRELWRVTE